LAMADALGRPVAILRLGARLPSNAAGPDEQFLYGCPPFVKYSPQRAAFSSQTAPERPQP